MSSITTLESPSQLESPSSIWMFGLPPRLSEAQSESSDGAQIRGGRPSEVTSENRTHSLSFATTLSSPKTK